MNWRDCPERPLNDFRPEDQEEEIDLQPYVDEVIEDIAESGMSILEYRKATKGENTLRAIERMME